MVSKVLFQFKKISLEENLVDMIDSYNGAVSTFFGITRNNFEGKLVNSLFYEAYESMARKELYKICDKIRNEYPLISNITIIHRLGAYRQSISETENYVGLSQENYSKDGRGFYQPFITIRCITTKECKIVTTISEALRSLDFKIAIRDIRRFGYVYRVLKILTVHKLSSLSGRTQIIVFELLKEVIKQVENNNGIQMIEKLLEDLDSTLETNKYNHLGSSQLWNNHRIAVKEMKETLNLFISNQKQNKENFKLNMLPQECLLKILSNLTCPKDFETVGEISFTFNNLVNDELLWRQLVMYHFNGNQLKSIMIENSLASFDDCNWKFIYKKLLKKYGDQHYFPVKLCRCFNCSALYWPIFGHPCDSKEENYKLLTPEDFISLFDI